MSRLAHTINVLASVFDVELWEGIRIPRELIFQPCTVQDFFLFLVV